MTRFLHLTDLHFAAAAPEAADKLARLRRLAETAAALRPPPAFAVLSGDLADSGDAESYRRLQPALAAFPVPVLTALGNHDRRGPFHAAFGTGAGEAPHRHAAAIGGLELLTLDTSVPGRVSGALDDAQIGWLAARLADRPDRPALIVLHHPPRLDPDALPWTCLDAGSTARLAAALDGRRIAGILAGHIHLNRVAVWRGIPVVTNTGLHYGIDPTHADGLRLVEGTGFGLGAWDGAGLSVGFAALTPEAREIARIDLDRLRSFA